MDRELAIKQIEQLQLFCSIRSGQSKDGAFARDCKALEMAISALRDQKITLDRSKWDGCDYCGDPQPYKDCVLPDGTERFLCSRDGLFGDCYINERKINYCPHCGKPLTEEAWAEMERRINGG